MTISTRPSQIALLSSLLLAVAIFTGCEPEMPMPPPRESTNPAEDDFYWAMERMEHAMERFQPSSSLGLRIKRELNYQLFPPSQDEADYTARVTIATRTVFTHDAPSKVQERKEAQEKKAKAAAEKLGLEDPYGPADDGPVDEALLPDGNMPAELPVSEVPDPRLPTHELKEDKEYLLRYADEQWNLESSELEETERMWFEYALQQGDFTPESAKKL